MKSLKSLLFFALFCISNIVAQTIKPIDAAWHKNDTLNYQLNQYVIEQLEDALPDTLQRIEKQLQMVVIDSAKFGYLIEWDFKTTAVDGPIKDPFIKQNIKLQFKTDALGMMQEIVNWETIRKQIYDEIELIIDQQLLDSEVLYWGNQPLESAYYFNSYEGISSLFLKDLQLMHPHYGTVYNLGESVNFENNIKVTYGNGKVDAKGKMLCDIDEDGLIQIKSDTKTNEAAIKNYYLNILKEVNGKLPRKKRKEIAKSELFITEVSNYKYYPDTFYLVQGNFKRTQLLDGVYNIEVAEIELR